MFGGGLLLRQKCWEGDLSYVCKMLDGMNIKDVQNDIKASMLKACEAGRADVVEYLLTLDIDFDYPKLFEFSCKLNNLELCNILIWYVTTFEKAAEIAFQTQQVNILKWIKDKFLNKTELKEEEFIYVPTDHCSDHPWFEKYIKHPLSLSFIVKNFESFNVEQRKDLFTWACEQRKVTIIRFFLDNEINVIKCGEPISELFNFKETIDIGYEILKQNPPSYVLHWIFSNACRKGLMNLILQLKDQINPQNQFRDFISAVKSNQRSITDLLVENALVSAAANRRQFFGHDKATFPDLEEAILCLRANNWMDLANLFSVKLAIVDVPLDKSILTSR